MDITNVWHGLDLTGVDLRVQYSEIYLKETVWHLVCNCLIQDRDRCGLL